MAAPRFDDGERAQDFGLKLALNLVGIAQGVIEALRHENYADAQAECDEERDERVKGHAGVDGFAGGTGRVRDADAVAEEARVDAGFLNLLAEVVEDGFIGIGVALEVFVFERFGVETVELGFVFVGHLMQLGLAILGLAEFGVDALHDGLFERFIARGQFVLAGGRLEVFGEAGAELRLDGGELLRLVGHQLFQFFELFALQGGLQSLHGAASDRLIGGGLPDEIFARIGPFGI